MRLWQYVTVVVSGQGLVCPPDTNTKNQIPGVMLNDPYYNGYDKCIYVVDGTKDKDLTWSKGN